MEELPRLESTMAPELCHRTQRRRRPIVDQAAESAADALTIPEESASEVLVCAFTTGRWRQVCEPEVTSLFGLLLRDNNEVTVKVTGG